MSLENQNTGYGSLTPDTFEQPAGIYVHIPFCLTKCPYCSFVSYPGLEPTIKNSYMEALGKQAQEMAGHSWVKKSKFNSLFVGGGTPSCVDPERLAVFIAACLDKFAFIRTNDGEPEVTVEANPNTVTMELLKQLRQAGVNRLSIGTQSFSDALLRNIGRTHTAHENVQAFEWARGAGFTNINLDLMYGLPGQNEVIWEESLQQAAALCPEHLSVYELTVEPGTPFAERAGNGKLNLPPEREALAMFKKAREILSAYGYMQYEISNYSRMGYACCHNITYWENGNYLGLGAGAVSCFSGVRIKSEENPDRFIQLLNNNEEPYGEAEFLPLEARFRETIIMGLRMTAGVSIKGLEARFGLTPQKYYGDVIAKLKHEKMLEEVGGRLRLTAKGLPLANWVMAQLV